MRLKAKMIQIIDTYIYFTLFISTTNVSWNWFFFGRLFLFFVYEFIYFLLTLQNSLFYSYLTPPPRLFFFLKITFSLKMDLHDMGFFFFL